MPITPTYPGIYIEELPSNAHTITGAPTSVTVFVGYTHPFKTNPVNWETAVEIFSFTDYEREFGGLYSSGVIESHVAYAVNQFFLNGGSDAYVVALQPSYYDAQGNDQGLVQASSVSVGPVTFTALEPIDLVPMTVTVNNIKTTFQANDTADILISYGSRGETYRKVNLNPIDSNFIGARINGVSQLITAAAAASSGFVGVGQAPMGYPPGQQPQPGWTAFSAVDFAPVFQPDSSLDKVPIFNLLLVPGWRTTASGAKRWLFASANSRSPSWIRRRRIPPTDSVPPTFP